jgi:hypothetical protein
MPSNPNPNREAIVRQAVHAQPQAPYMSHLQKEQAVQAALPHFTGTNWDVAAQRGVEQTLFK